MRRHLRTLQHPLDSQATHHLAWPVVRWHGKRTSLHASCGAKCLRLKSAPTRVAHYLVSSTHKDTAFRTPRVSSVQATHETSRTTTVVSRRHTRHTRLSR